MPTLLCLPEPSTLLQRLTYQSLLGVTHGTLTAECSYIRSMLQHGTMPSCELDYSAHPRTARADGVSVGCIAEYTGHHPAYWRCVIGSPSHPHRAPLDAALTLSLSLVQTLTPTLTWPHSD